MDERVGYLILLVATIALICIGSRVISAIENVKIAKYQTFSPPSELEAVTDTLVDLAVYDLHNYTEWLDEKGVLREGFKRDLLVQEYVLNDD